MANPHGPALPPDDDVWETRAPRQVEDRKKPARLRGGIAVVAGVLAVLVGVPLLQGGEPPSPSPNASSSGSVPPSPYAAPGEVTIDPSLPDALPLPEGIWDEVEPGWVLVDYMPVILGRSDGGIGRPILEYTKHVVYLISPDGTRYQVAEFSPDVMFAITAWTAGETVAYGSECWEPGYCDWRPALMLDLETGTVTSADDQWAGSGDVRYSSTLPDGTRLFGTRGVGGGYLEIGERGARTWTEIDQRWATLFPAVAASPDGDYLALATSDELSFIPDGDGDTSEILILSLEDGDETRTPMLGGDWQCIPRDWLGPTRLAMRCDSIDEMRDVYYIYDLVTDELTPGAEGHYNDDATQREEIVESYVQRDYQVDYGLYAGSYCEANVAEPDDQAEKCTMGIDDHGELTCVVLLDPAGDPLYNLDFETHVGDVLYILADSGTYFEAGETIVAYNIATGSQTILIGPPLAGPTFGWEEDVDEGVWARAVLSWAVAH